MKILTLIVAIFAMGITEIHAQEYLVVTTVESVVPGGVGRSRMIVQRDTINVDQFTTSRTDGKKSNQKDVSRSDAKISVFDETKLLNFYSMVGINFQNIASNSYRAGAGVLTAACRHLVFHAQDISKLQK